ncbi:MAG: hypothetical protein IPP74_01345 [Alphaproteobacteria bacterium]|nr:hypothetical protein [Alphaproteobacteria bacterium]
MKFNDAFYYNQAIEGKLYSRLAPGDIDVGRIFKRKPYYRKDAGGFIQKPKTLIFADWTFNYWNDWERLHAVKVMEEWLDQGGKILAWFGSGSTDGPLGHLTKEWLAKNRHTKWDTELIYLSPEIMRKKACEQYKIAYDELHVLDYYWLKNWNVTDKLPKYYIDKRYRFQDKNTQKIIDEHNANVPHKEGYLTYSREDYLELNLEFNSDGLTDSRLESHWPYLQYTKEVTIKCKGELSEEVLVKLLSQSPNIESFIYEGYTLKDSQLRKILSLCPGLKTLRLRINRLSNTQGLEGIELDHLKVLTIESYPLTDSKIFEIDEVIIQQLLSASPRLELIDLNNVLGFTDSSLDKIKLENLQVISFSNCNITAKQLGALLARSPVRSLTVKNCNNLGSTDLLELKLTHLKILFASGSTISAQQLQALLAHAKVKELSISDCKKLVYADFSEFNLTHIEKLTISNSTITSQQLCALVARTQLRFLDIIHCMNLGNADLPVLKLTHLEYLYIAYSTITPQLLGALVVDSPVAELKIISCETLGDADLPALKLTHLKNLYIQDSTLTAQQLRAHLSQANECEVAIVNCENFDDNIIDEFKNEFPNFNFYFSPYIPSSKKDSIYQPCNPIHTPSEHRNFTPHDPNKPFEFKGQNKTYNQNMIIEKLSQYLTLTNYRTNIIPQIQDGICSALSNLFIENCNIFSNEIKAIQQWNGSLEALNSLNEDNKSKLENAFKRILSYIDKYQLSNTRTPTNYLGSSARSFIKDVANSLSNSNYLILSNPWHAISVMLIEKSWFVYDPNYVNGCKKFDTFDGAYKAITESLGSLIFVDRSGIQLLPELGKPIENPNDFMRDGGLLVLYKASWSDVEQLLELMKGCQLDHNGLSGLFLRDLMGFPAWYRGLTSPDIGVKKLTQRYLLQLLRQDKQAIQKLEKSFEAIPQTQRLSVKDILVQQDTTRKRLATEMERFQKQALKAQQHQVRKEHYQNQLLRPIKDKTVEEVSTYCQQLLNPQKMLKNNTIRRTMAIEVESKPSTF